MENVYKDGYILKLIKEATENEEAATELFKTLETMEQDLNERPGLNIIDIIDFEVEKIVKKFLKRNKQFKRVANKEQATAMFVFNREDLLNYSFLCIEKIDNDILNNEYDGITKIYVKHTNPHDRRNATIGYIRRSRASALRNGRK